MKKKLFTIIFIFILGISFGQDSEYTICDCCTYSMFQFKNDFDKTFSPAIIKANNIKELTIYTTSKRKENQKDSFKVVDKEYKEMIFRFNANGYVESQILFNRRGQYHSIYNFKRSNDNKVLSKTFHYLDSLGKKIDDLMTQKWKYVYSDYNLIEVKKLDENSIEQPDDKSDFVFYNYDIKGRVIEQISHSYYDEQIEPSIYKTKIKYNEISNESVSITKEKKELFSTKKIKYTKSQKLLNEKTFDGNNKLIEESKFTYNNNEQLIKFQVKNSGLATECPDGGDFEDIYSYSSLQLIEKIQHYYENTLCQLRFIYK